MCGTRYVIFDIKAPSFTRVNSLHPFKDGKAYIMGDNKDATTVGVSEYDVVKDQGVVLTFPIYNGVIHELAGSSQGYPEGLQGDYEFAILEANANFIRLRGKK